MSDHELTPEDLARSNLRPKTLVTRCARCKRTERVCREIRGRRICRWCAANAKGKNK